MPTPVTIYITKGAMDFGILKARAVCVPQGQACLVDDRGMAVPGEPLLEADDFTDTLLEARQAVEREIAERIAGHHAEIARLRALDLSVAVEG